MTTILTLTTLLALIALTSVFLLSKCFFLAPYRIGWLMKFATVTLVHAGLHSLLVQ